MQNKMCLKICSISILTTLFQKPNLNNSIGCISSWFSSIISICFSHGSTSSGSSSSSVIEILVVQQL